MCIEIENVTVTTKRIIAYKRMLRLNAHTGGSCVLYRKIQNGAKTTGTRLKYQIGKTVESGDPGIYLYARKPRGARIRRHYMVVEIPAGTVIARGRQNGVRAILAQRINVLGWL